MADASSKTYVNRERYRSQHFVNHLTFRSALGASIRRTPFMEGTRKQAISLRVAARDLRKLKKLAERLGVHDSDVIRFAVKMMLARMAPLCDHSVRGRALLPVFLEAGSDLCRHFDLDAARLVEIFNDGVAKDQEVEPEDLQLIAMAGIQQTYGKLGLGNVPPGLGAER